MTRAMRYQDETGERLLTRAEVTQGRDTRPVGPIGLGAATMDELLDANDHSLGAASIPHSSGLVADFVSQAALVRCRKPDRAEPVQCPDYYLFLCIHLLIVFRFDPRCWSDDTT